MGLATVVTTSEPEIVHAFIKWGC